MRRVLEDSTIQEDPYYDYRPSLGSKVFGPRLHHVNFGIPSTMDLVIKEESAKTLSQITVSYEFIDQFDKEEGFHSLHAGNFLVKKENDVDSDMRQQFFANDIADPAISSSFSIVDGLAGVKDEPELDETPVLAKEEAGGSGFEDAMDDWYSKISAHGPLNDSEILESALQLSQHFNYEFPLDAVWLENFKSRQIRKNRNPQEGDVKVDSDESYYSLYGPREVSPEPKKSDCGGKQFNPLTDLSRDADYPLLLISANSSRSIGEDELFVSKRTLPSRRRRRRAIREAERKPVDVADQVGGFRISASDPSSSAGGVHQSQHETSDVGTDPGDASRLLTLDSSSSTGYEVPSLAIEGVRLSVFEAQVLDWYTSLTSKYKAMVAVSVFENKVVELARTQELFLFRPTKAWVKGFMKRYGMWCTIGGTRLFVIEPKSGLLKSRFDLEFEAWYYSFPTPPDNMECQWSPDQPEIRSKLKKFWLALFERPPSDDASPTDEVKIAESTGFTQDEYRQAEEYYCPEWSRRHALFYESVKRVFCSLYDMITPQILRRVGSEQASTFGFLGFTPNEMWMRRFLELNGLRYKKDGVVQWYMLDATHCSGDTFAGIFKCWRTYRGGPIMKDILRVELPGQHPEKQGELLTGVDACSFDDSIVIKEEPI